MDVKDALQRLGIQIVKESGQRITARCPNPEHDDRNPSWGIDKDTGLHHCFSCGYKGNLITLVWELQRTNPYEFLGTSPQSMNAVRWGETGNREQFPRIQRNLDVEGHTWSATTSHEVMRYLHSVGADLKAVDHFDIRFMIHGGVRFLSNVDYTPFHYRLFVPVKDEGNVVNIIGRDYTGKQKPKELYPRGSTTDLLFNLDRVDLGKEVIVVEGFKALLRLWSAGYHNVVSTFGSMLGKNQLRQLEAIPRILLFPDNDEAGEKMIQQVEQSTKDFRLALMPVQGMDPADGTLNQLVNAIETARNYAEVVLTRFQERGIMNSQGRTTQCLNTLF